MVQRCLPERMVLLFFRKQSIGMGGVRGGGCHQKGEGDQERLKIHPVQLVELLSKQSIFSKQTLGIKGGMLGAKPPSKIMDQALVSMMG